MAYVNVGVKEDQTYEMMDLNSETTGQYMNSDESNSAHTTEPAHIANVIEDHTYKNVNENTDINGEDEYTLPTISTFNDYINATIGDNEDNSYATVNENTTSNNDIDTDVYTPARVCAQAHIGSTNYCKRKTCKIIPITLISFVVIAGVALGVVLTLKHQGYTCSTNPCRTGLTCFDHTDSYSCSCVAGKDCPIHIGDRVKRGRDWQWNSQDGHGLGTINTTVPKYPGWIRVKWDFDGSINDYRMGAQNSYDLDIVQ